MTDITAAEKVVGLITDLATAVADAKSGGAIWKEIPDAIAVLGDLQGISSSLPEIRSEIQAALADPPALADLLTEVIEATLKLIAATA